MLIIHLGLPKSGTSSIQKMVSLINNENCLSSSFEYLKNHHLSLQTKIELFITVYIE